MWSVPARTTFFNQVNHCPNISSDYSTKSPSKHEIWNMYYVNTYKTELTTFGLISRVNTIGMQWWALPRETAFCLQVFPVPGKYGRLTEKPQKSSMDTAILKNP